MARLIALPQGRRRFLGGLGLAVFLLPTGIGAWKFARVGRVSTPISPNSSLEPTARRVPPPWAGHAEDVLKKDASGKWIVPYDKITTYLHDNLTAAPTLGERNHKLIPNAGDNVYASIIPFRETKARALEDLEDGLVIAVIQSSANYSRLGLYKGDNYFFIYQASFLWVFKSWKVVMISDQGRTKLKKFDYKPHTLTNGYQKSAFTKAAYHCEHDLGLLACFVDSPEFQTQPGVPPPSSAGFLGTGLLWARLRRWLFRDSGAESQPWAACTQYGCCCGGENCHPT